MKHINQFYLITTVLVLTTLLQTSCVAHDLNWGRGDATNKGVAQVMRTYFLGRFSIAIPEEMEEQSRLQKLRDVKVNEMIWPRESDHVKSREVEWDKFLAGITKLPIPRGKDRIIIKKYDLASTGKWAKGILYYNDQGNSRTAPWSLLMDTGSVYVWLETIPVVVEEDLKKDLAISNLNEICQSYKTLETGGIKWGSFYLKYGAINLPYLWQEESYIRFEKHPLDLKIEIDMDMDSAYKREKHGLIEKSSAVIDSGYAAMAQVKIQRIRSRKREVAGMPGEEVVDRLVTKDKTEFDFGWEYVGKNDSGEYPTVRITMESPDGKQEEKLKIWDAVLDSMKPMFVRNK